MRLEPSEDMSRKSAPCNGRSPCLFLSPQTSRRGDVVVDTNGPTVLKAAVPKASVPKALEVSPHPRCGFRHMFTAIVICGTGVGVHFF